MKNPQEEPKIVTVNAESATGEYLATVSYIPLPHLDYTPKQETLEQAAERLLKDNLVTPYEKPSFKNGFIEGAKWQAERMYSEEDMISFAKFFTQYTFIDNTSVGDLYALDETGNHPAYKIAELISIFKKK